jgi:glutamate/tyrosine decarboxylase-like PLP-dependent enzyme
MQEPDYRALFRRAAEHAADFRESVGERKARPLRSYHDMLEVFAESLPEQPGDGLAIVDELVAKADQGLMMPTHPRFFGWVIGASHGVAVAADMLTAAWGQNAGNHLAVPAAAAAEDTASRWLLDLLDLPSESSVGFVTGATIASFVGLAAARGEVLRRVGWDADSQGLFGAPPITVVIGDDAHTTVFGALQFLGLGHDRVVRVATTAQGVMEPEAFAAAVNEIAGPAIVILQAGQINTGAFDDFTTFIPMAHARGAWVHVDGAFGLWARATPRYRPLTRGIELADSWATDGHKWLQTPYDCGYAIVRHELPHRRAMTIAASYLPAAADGERDPTHYVPELSRRARGFATWAAIKAMGRAGIAAMVERHCATARVIAEIVSAEPGVAVLNDVVLNQAIVRFGADLGDEEGDALTRATIARIQQDGDCFAGGARWRGREVMRVSVIDFPTDEAQGRRAAQAMLRAYRAVRKRVELVTVT